MHFPVQGLSQNYCSLTNTARYIEKFLEIRKKRKIPNFTRINSTSSKPGCFANNREKLQVSFIAVSQINFLNARFFLTSAGNSSNSGPYIKEGYELLTFRICDMSLSHEILEIKQITLKYQPEKENVWTRLSSILRFLRDYYTQQSLIRSAVNYSKNSYEILLVSSIEMLRTIEPSTRIKKVNTKFLAHNIGTKQIKQTIAFSPARK